MTFEENPFRVLNVSIYDTKATIVERADELSFAEPDDEKIIDEAKNILLNPRKRIAAEVHLLVGDELDIENLLKDILRVDKKFSALNVGEIRDQINAARKKSKFPAVNDTKAIADELKNLRGEIREKIQYKFQAADHRMRVSFANFVVDKLAAGNFGVVIEDFFDSYKLEMSAFFDAATKHIADLLKRIKINADKKSFDALAFHVTEFVRARKPLDEFSILEGTNNFDDSAKIFLTVRNLAAELYNEQKLIDEPLKIMRLLAEKFSYLPVFPAALIREEIEILEEAKRQQPTQAFIRAKSELDKIQTEMDKWLHFEKGFEQVNQDFYKIIFKPRLESVLKNVLKCFDLNSEEVRKLNRMIAEIYVQVGNAMTWATRADLAYECFEKALPYAEAAYSANLVSLVRQRINEWRAPSEDISAQIPIEYRDKFLTRILWKCLIAIKEILYGLAMATGEFLLRALIVAVFFLIYWLLSH